MGKRSLESNGRKLNLVKVGLAILLVIMVIASIVFLVKSINKSDEEKSTDNEVVNTAIEEENTVEKQVSINNIDKVVSDFGGEIKEKVKEDTYYISKDGEDFTAYADGEIVSGRIVLWDGSEAKPAIDEAGNINIYSAAELAWVANRVISGEKNFNGVTITLRRNIDLGGREKEDGTWEGNNWNSIIGFLDELPNASSGNTVANQDVVIDDSMEVKNENLKRFAGVFNGNGLSIRGMKIDTDKRYQGLFGYQSGTIQNLTIKYSNVKAGESSGILVGLNEGTIENCKIENSSISSGEKTGGLIGTAMTNTNIENCEIDENSKVTGENNVGGLIGYINNNVTILDSTSKAKVLGKEYVGGIAGISFYGTSLKKVKVEGSIEGENYVGGIVGYSQAEIVNSTNSAVVSGKNYVGGFVGLNYLMGNIIESFNEGKITVTDENAGGIVGLNNGSISNCYNKGEIDSTQTDKLTIGGICGQNGSESFINTSYNIGKIKNKNYAGGVVGADFGTISNCFCLDTCLEKDTNDTDYKKSEEEMKNNVISSIGEAFEKDENNINSGYPILYWQEN